MTPSTILHLLGSARPAGAGHSRLVSSLARGLDPDRFRIVAAFLGDEGPLIAELREAGAVVMPTKWGGSASSPRGVVNFAQALRAIDPAVVHRHMGGRAVSGLGRRVGRAIVLAHLHGARDERHAHDISAMVVRGADAIVATSRAAAVGIRPTAHVVPPGVVVPDRPPALPSPRQPVVVGTIGRLAPIKDIGNLIRALPAVLGSGHDVVLEILGEGPCEGDLRAEAKRLGIESRVRFLGWHADLRPHLERFDVYVQSSLYEGFGIATLEAMAQARPVVATAVGGTPELVTPASGVLLPPDDAAALADAITALLGSRERRDALGQAAWARATAFSESEMVRATAELYEELLNPLPAGRPGLLGLASRLRRLKGGLRPEGPAHCIKRGYLRRIAPTYFTDAQTHRVVWQPTVYAETATIAREVDATRIVDIGCGAGTRLMEQASEFATIGLDFGANVQHARETFPQARWVEHDLDSDYPWPLTPADLSGSVLLAADVIEHLREPRRLLAALELALAHCGAVVLTTPDRDLTWGIRHRGPPPNPAHVREWNSHEFGAFLRSHGLVNCQLSLTRSNDRDPGDHTILAVVFPTP